MTIGVNQAKEPEGELCQPRDIFEWVEGLTKERWRKIRPTLRTHVLPGCVRPYYFTTEIREKLVKPIQGDKNK